MLLVLVSVLVLPPAVTGIGFTENVFEAKYFFNRSSHFYYEFIFSKRVSVTNCP
jgi:hypothetical protein